MPPRPPYLFLLIAGLTGAGCVYLGTWQLDRHAQRRAYNQAVEARIHQQPVPVDSVFAAGAEGLRFRAVMLTGEPDYEHEVVLATRSHNGSPGVHLLTPVRVPGHDEAILVNRGWVYSPDGVSVDLARWRDSALVVTGFVEEFTPAEGGATLPSRPRSVRRMDRDSLAPMFPYPIAPVYVVLTGDGAPSPDRPARLSTPALGDGPHFSYAVQWFGFAAVAVVGAGIVALRGRNPRSGGVGGA
jgi:surfeit locus 1 family protein